MNTQGFELKSFGLEIVNDLPGYWTGLENPAVPEFTPQDPEFTPQNPAVTTRIILLSINRPTPLCQDQSSSSS